MAKRPRENDVDFELETNPALVYKFVAAAFGSIAFVVFGFCGFVYLTDPALRGQSGNTESRFQIPSMMGILVSMQTGGKTSPWQWDKTMQGMCTQMAGLAQTMRSFDGESESSENRAARGRAEGRCKGH